MIITKSFLHPIAEEYFDKIEIAGGNVQDKNSINKFVNELSRIIHPSLWVCWPLRSQHNIGTGTTTYSLGGFGNYSGTLTNGPTWGTNGINFVKSSSQYISTNFNTNSNAFTVLTISLNNSTTANQYTVARDNGSQRIWGIFNNATVIQGYVFNTGFNSIASGTTQTSNYECRILRHSDTNFNFQTIGSSLATGSAGNLNSSNVSLFIGARNASTDTFNGNISLVLYFTSYLTDTNITSIYNLIKQTLGSGLGLL